jgi:hypothetical protein
MDFEAWRCCHDDSKFCPDEGCPKHLGCARDRGWKRGDPTPDAYKGIVGAVPPPVVERA